MKHPRTLVIISIIFLNFTAFSQEMETDRPDQTEGSSSVPGGSLQIETGTLFEFFSEEDISARVIAVPTTLLRYGVVKGFELRLTNQFESFKSQDDSVNISGIGDMEFGFKVEILAKEDINTKIAFLSHVLIPTGSKEVTIDRYGTINKLAVSHDLGKNLGLGYNLGYNYFGEGNGMLTYSLVLGIGVGEKAGIYVEPYGDLFDMKTHYASFDAGVTYLIADNFQLDMSFGTGINHTMNFISFGFSWRIDKK